MSVQVSLDKAGRVIIPKAVRESLRLHAGDALEMASTEEQITLRPVRGTAPLTKEQGVWVFRTGQPLPVASTDEVLRQLRAERDSSHVGGNE